MIVCIAEKPSVAADIARILGATKDCRVRGNGWYEGNGYQVTWTYGHLCELKNPDEYSPMWKAWALTTLPMIPPRFGIRLKEGVEEQFACIEKLFKAADRIINCGDAGQEGELIQRWVLQKTQATCPVDRLWISSMTDEAIREGFANLKPQSEYQTLYEAGLCRAIGDWLLGMNATRLYTLKYGSQGSYSSRPQPLSIGRVQTPTLALIVKRQLEIEHFKPEPYWVLSTIYRDVTFTAKLEDEADNAGNTGSAGENSGNSATYTSGATKRGFTNKEEAERALKDIENTPFRVTKVEKKNGTEAPPRLFDLTSLQVECNKKFGYGADLTLQIIQQLYEGKYTTYPRVDTTFLPDDVYPKCGQIMNGIANVPVDSSQPGLTYGSFMTPLRGTPLKKSKKVFDTSKVTDHHAIIPTGVAPRALTDMQRNVFDLIARRFIAVFYPDCKFATTTVEGSPVITGSEGSPELYPVVFRATAKVITDPAWKVIFSHTAGSENSGKSAKSGQSDTVEIQGAFTKGEEGPHTPTLTEKETQPPKPYTEATLLRAMETAGRTVEDEELRDAMKENGIGRPSTRAAIIQTLYKRGYMRKAGKSNLEATPTGIELIGLIKEELLKSAELTGLWEKKLRQIESHQYSAPQFIAELKQMVTDIVHQVMSDPTNRRVTAQPTAAPAGNASSTKKSAGNPTSTKKSVGNATSTQKSDEAKPKRKIIREGSVCPVCGQGKVIKGNANYGCSRWREGCTFRKPFKK